MCVQFVIEFIGFMLEGKSFLVYANLCSPDEYEENVKMILMIFSITVKVNMKKIYCIICGKYRKSGKPQISYILEKTLALSITCRGCQKENKKIFKEAESIEILRFLV